MNVKIADSWKERLSDEFEKPYFSKLIEFVKSEYSSSKIYPPGKLIFNTFDKCSFENTKVVILGQDPYHGENQANGLSFSVNDGVTSPPSLKNIFKEIKDDLGIGIPKSGNLERWANQGVLLLNSTLTVRAGEETFTDAVIKCISEQKQDVVFMLWGKYAQDKGAVIEGSKHLILKAKHPSPMAANYGGWFGTKHFSQANDYLISKNLEPINW
jgi:uracil-DNA glycosylase